MHICLICMVLIDASLTGVTQGSSERYWYRYRGQRSADEYESTSVCVRSRFAGLSPPNWVTVSLSTNLDLTATIFILSTILCKRTSRRDLGALKRRRATATSHSEKSNYFIRTPKCIKANQSI